MGQHLSHQTNIGTDLPPVHCHPHYLTNSLQNRGTQGNNQVSRQKTGVSECEHHGGNTVIFYKVDKRNVLWNNSNGVQDRGGGADHDRSPIREWTR